MEVSEQRSRALHVAIAERVRDDPSIIARARTRVASWRSNGGAHRYYCDAWDDVLEQPVEAIVAFLLDAERSEELRQVSPFGGVLAPRERWEILRAVRATT